MTKLPVMNDLDYEPSDIEVRVAELLVATPDAADDALDSRVQEVLRLLRERMNMDVCFVSQFCDGQRVFRAVDQSPAMGGRIRVGAADPLEASWCQRVVDGRLPGFMPDAEPWMASGQAPRPDFPIGTHLSTPVVLDDGHVYGTLCCFSTRVNTDTTSADLRRLRYTAQLLASKLRPQALS